MWHDSLLHVPSKTIRDVTWFIHICDMVHSYLRHDSFTRVTWLIYNFEMAHIYVWRDSLLHVLSKTQQDVTWLIYMCDRTRLYVWHDSFTRLELLVYDITRLRSWRDSFMCVTWLRMCDMTYSYAWHDLFTCVTWLIQMCDMTYEHVWHDSFICVTWLIHIGTWLFRMCYISHAQASDMTYSHVWHDYLFMLHDLFICVTWPSSYVWHYSHINTWHDAFFFAIWFVGETKKTKCDMTHVIWWRDSLHLCDMMGSAGEGVRGAKHNVGSCDKTHSWIIYEKTNRTWAPGTWFINFFS